MQRANRTIPTAFQTLSSFERSLLHLASILYEAVNRATFASCLRRAGITGPRGEWLTPNSLAPFFQKLQDLELLDKNGRCPDDIVELVSRDALAAGSFGKMAEAVEAELPFSQYQPKGPNRCFRAMRQYRLGLYRGDMVQLENMHPMLDKFCPEEDTRLFPVVRFCSNPFDPEWHRGLAPSLQFYILGQLMNYSLSYLSMLERPYSYLKNEKNLAAIPGEERLPFLRLLAAMFLWRGELAALEELMASYPGSFVASGMEGSLHFLQGRNEKALESFEGDLRQLKKIGVRRRIYFPSAPGLFFILALLKTGSVSSFGRIRRFIETVRTQQPGNILLGAYEMLDLFLTAQESGSPDLKPGGPGAAGNSITALFTGLLRFWLTGSVPAAAEGDGLPALRLLSSRARQGGFQWIAMVLAELIGGAEQDREMLDFAAGIAARTGMAPVAEAVVLEDLWKRRLRALIGITGEKEPYSGEKERRCRMIWRVGYRDGLLSISPREQRLGTDNCWSGGRPIALSRIYSGKNMDFISEADRRICKTLKREQGNQNVTYRFDLKQALPAMVGHPLLFLEESPATPVEFVRGEPELIVEKLGNELCLRLLKDFAEEGITVIRETPTRFKIIEVTKKHKDIARIISGSGLRLPVSHTREAMAAVGNLSSFMTVHSAIAVDTGTINALTGQEDVIKGVAASRQIYIQLIPLGEGFRLAMFVKPFGSGGPYLKPGHGAENVMAEVNGQRLQARRNLALEEKKAREIEAACPTLTGLEERGREWLLQETATCLDVLLELQAVMDRVVVEWPEGRRIAVRSMAAPEKLSLQVRRAKGRTALSWFSLSGSLTIDESLVVDMKKLVELAIENPGRFLPLGNGEFLALTDEFRRRLDDFAAIADVAIEKDGVVRELRVHPLAAMALENIAHGLGSLEADAGWAEQLRLIREAQELTPVVPSTLQADLRDYQAEGYRWLSRLAHWGGGACLADDMGLGKTLQALAIILEKCSCGPVLVVAPTSVCMNWLQEAARFAPTLNMHLLGNRNRKKLVRALKPFDVLVTSYTLLQQEAKILAGIIWEVIVLDEAQAIKNMETKRSQAAMSLQGRFRLLTTGTPVENHLGELWNLFNFIIPGLLGSLESFNRRFAIPIERYGDKGARRKLKKLIQPFILRRTKAEVLEELPSRTEITLQVEMNDEEQAFYEANRRQALENIGGKNSGTGAAGRRNASPVTVSGRNNGRVYTVKILAEIMKLRRACCNPKLVMPESNIASSKLLLFGKVVDELLENRHKALVFSQFVGHLKIIRAFLDEKKIEYRYLDGTTPVKQREREVTAFQAGRGDLFLISLKAGGLGLNLTAADYVIHMDPWWNPAVEDQASDRAHRIGQVHPVTIYRLITKNTIEEKIVRLHRDKRELANSLLAETGISSRISAEELLNLIREQ